MYKELLEDLQTSLSRAEDFISSSIDDLEYYQREESSPREDEEIDSVKYLVEDLISTIDDLVDHINNLL